MAITFSSQAADLYLYCWRGLKEPVEKIVKQFEQNTGNKVTVRSGASKTKANPDKVTVWRPVKHPPSRN